MKLTNVGYLAFGTMFMVLAQPAIVSADYVAPVGSDAVSAETSAVSLKPAGFYDNWIKGRLGFGLRLNTVSLDSTSRIESPYVGNLDHISEKDSTYVTLVMEYHFTDCLSLELSYENVKGQFYNNVSEDRGGGSTDGYLELSGSVMLAKIRIPGDALEQIDFPRSLRPYIGFGIAFWSADFHEAPWWHLGYPNPTSYEDMGRPSQNRGKTRTMHVDDLNSFVLAVGLDWIITDNWTLELQYRKVSADPDALFTSTVGSHVEGDFDLSHSALSLTAQYYF